MRCHGRQNRRDGHVSSPPGWMIQSKTSMARHGPVRRRSRGIRRWPARPPSTAAKPASGPRTKLLVREDGGVRSPLRALGAPITDTEPAWWRRCGHLDHLCSAGDLCARARPPASVCTPPRGHGCGEGPRGVLPVGLRVHADQSVDSSALGGPAWATTRLRLGRGGVTGSSGASATGVVGATPLSPAMPVSGAPALSTGAVRSTG